MDVIHCQKCQHGDRQGGCSVCGGAGELLARIQVCSICNRTAWVRPGVFSKYEGQIYKTFDGVSVVSHLSKPDNCLECEK